MRRFSADGDWDWTRPKEDIFAPAKDFEGNVRNDSGDTNTGPNRRNQRIWRHDRKQDLNRQPEPYGYPQWMALVNPEKIISGWNPEDYIDEIYNQAAGQEIGDNKLNLIPMNQGGYDLAAGRELNMRKIAEEKEQEEKDKLKEERKELGITLNANGMPFVTFRDGSFAEVRKKAEDARRRHQGIDEETEYMVINTYPSLGYENELGRGGYRTVEAAEKMLINYAKPHIARGLTYTY